MKLLYNHFGSYNGLNENIVEEIKWHWCCYTNSPNTDPWTGINKVVACCPPGQESSLWRMTFLPACILPLRAVRAWIMIQPVTCCQDNHCTGPSSTTPPKLAEANPWTGLLARDTCSVWHIFLLRTHCTLLVIFSPKNPAQEPMSQWLNV